MPSQLLLVLLALCACCATPAPPQLDRAIARLQRSNDAYLSELEELVGEVGQVVSERLAVLSGPCKSMTPCCHVACAAVHSHPNRQLSATALARHSKSSWLVGATA